MANTKFQFKRTTVTGRTPNTSDPANTSYIAPGEFALNLADGKLFTSNGDLITIGSNQTTINAQQGNFNNIATDGGIAIGNSTVNASINSTALFAGNNSTNVVVNTTILTVSNSSTNSTISPSFISVGNSSTNTSFNIVTGSRELYINAYSYSDSTKTLTLTTNAAHLISPPLRGQYITLSNLPSEISSLNGTKEVVAVPTSNSFSIRAVLSSDIASISRTNGVASVTTKTAHGLTGGSVVTVSGVGGLATLPSVTFDGSITVLSSPTPTSTTFSYNNNPRIDSTVSSLFVDAASATKTITIKTSSAHGYSSGLPLTSVGAPPNVTATVNSEIVAVCFPQVSACTVSGAITDQALLITNDTFVNRFATGIPSDQLQLTLTAQNLNPKTVNNPFYIVKWKKNSTSSSSRTYYFLTSEPHGLETGTRVTISGVDNAVNGVRNITRAGDNEFYITDGSTSSKNTTYEASSGTFTVSAPNSLAWTSSRAITTYSNLPKVLRTSAPTKTNWIGEVLPKNSFKIKSITRPSSTSSTVTVTYIATFNSSTGTSPTQQFAVGDWVFLWIKGTTVSYKTTKRRIYNIGENYKSGITPAAITDANVFGGVYEITAIGTSGSDFTFSFTIADANKTEWGTDTTTTVDSTGDRIERFYKISGSAQLYHNFSASFLTPTVLSYINTTAFSLPITTAMTANLGATNALVTASAGTMRFNTDFASFSPVAGKVGSSITSGSATANGLFEIVPSVSVANTQDSIKITPSTFYTGNSTANLFADPSQLNILAQESLFSANASELSIRSATTGVADDSKPMFIANTSVLYIGYSSATAAGDPGKKFFKAEPGITKVFGSELVVGTEIENTSISNAYLTLSSNGYTSSITSTDANFAGNVNVNGSISFSNSFGTAGQVLTTDGTLTYWSDPQYFDPTIGTNFDSYVNIRNNNLSVTGENGSITINDELENSLSLTTTEITSSSNTGSATTILASGFSITSNTANTDTSENIVANTKAIVVGNSSVNATINSTVFTGTANNTSFVGSVSAANVVSNAQLSANLGNYQTTAGLAANVATLTANNTSFVGSVSAANVVSNAQLSGNLANYQTTAGLAANVATLTANNTTYFGGNAITEFVRVTDAHTVSGNITFNGNLTIGTSAGINANGGYGSAGQVLTSNGTTLYWSSVGGSGTVTSVASGNGLIGGPITSSGTLYVLANNGIVANSTGIFVDTAYSYNWSNTHTFTNTVFLNAVSSNGSLGTAGQVLTSNGSDTYWSTPATSSNGTIVGNSQVFTTNGTSNAFTLSYAINNISDLVVSLNGLIQTPTTHYTVSGNTVTFTSTPSNNSVVEVRSFTGSGAIGTPPTMQVFTYSAPSGTWTRGASKTGTYSRSGSNTTVTSNGHGFSVGDFIYLDFTSGTAVDGWYDISSVTSNTFVVAQGSGTTGNVTVYPPLVITSDGHGLANGGTVYVNYAQTFDDDYYEVKKANSSTFQVQASTVTQGLSNTGSVTLETLNSSQTWTKPTGCRSVSVRVVGGGASTNTAPTISTSAPAGGGYSEEIIDVSAVSTVTVTIGKGGKTSMGSGTYVAAPPSSVRDGGTSSFGSYLSATGGSVNTPGTGSGGTINVTGTKSVYVVTASYQEAFGGTSAFGAGSYGMGGTAYYDGCTYTVVDGKAGVVLVTEYY